MSPTRLVLLALALATPAAAQNAPVVGFDDGAQGWSINGLDGISPNGGNPGEFVRYPDPIDTFGIAARNNTNASFLGDYTAKGDSTLSIDVRVNYISFFGTPAPREFVVMLYDDDPFGAAPPAQVWSSLGVLDGNGMPWTTFDVQVTDVFSDTLPAGWNGAGDEDPQTFEPILPAGRTWTNVLQGVDRIEFTTFVPGFFFGFTNFDVGIDNVSIQGDASPWTDLGNGLAGSGGTPALLGDGPLTAGSTTTLELDGALAGSTAYLVLGLTDINAAFKGGVLVPSADLVFALPVSGTGELDIGFAWPGGPSGVSTYWQYWIVDAGGPVGFAASNAVQGTTP